MAENAVAPREKNANALVGSTGGMKLLLKADAFQRALADVLPRHITPERMAKFALVAANKNPTLLKCTQTSIMQSIMDSASYGLDCSGLGGRGYLVPYYSNKKGCYEAQFIPGYRGLMDVARRSGMVDAIWANLVYEGERFSNKEGTEHRIEHTPDDAVDHDDDKIIGAYACAKLKGSNTVEYRYVSRRELESVKARALAKLKNKEASTWVSEYAAMCRKTALRRLCSDLPQSAEIMNLIEHDNRVEPIIDITPDKVGVADPGDALVNELTGEQKPQEQETPEEQSARAALKRETESAFARPIGKTRQAPASAYAREFDPIICGEAKCPNAVTTDTGEIVQKGDCAAQPKCARE